MGFRDYWKAVAWRAGAAVMTWAGGASASRDANERTVYTLERGKLFFALLKYLVLVAVLTAAQHAASIDLDRALWQAFLGAAVGCYLIAFAMTPPALAREEARVDAKALEDADKEARDAKDEVVKARAALDDATRRRAAADALAQRLPEGYRIAVELVPAFPGPAIMLAITEPEDRGRADYQNAQVDMHRAQWHAGWINRRNKWIDETRDMIASKLGSAEAEVWRYVLFKGVALSPAYEQQEREEITLLIEGLRTLIERQNVRVLEKRD